ncbi:cell division protein FtsK [Streptomyces sp. CB01881]|uniref:cell division protein FtsK n=1 Tax=Streptomyces sp. CB01881 TaxID=2078691 RepID=UPI000CDC8D20|nr:cell division protein FtsK [Streptomyces sp. CB01881]AUY51920.1 cell division protein FtsK [Streptomyces sp. CB01881]TYC71349.1 cell division protein FtsK [Streptomyces sp. CB01881]
MNHEQLSPADEPEQPGTAPDSGEGAAVLPFPDRFRKTPRPAPDTDRDEEPGGVDPDEVDLPDDEGEDDERRPVEGTLVDPAPAADPSTPAEIRAAKTAARLPVFPAWLRSTEEFRAVATWAAGHYCAVSAYHAVRAPLYVGKVAAYAPRGGWRWAGGVRRWVFDAEGAPLRAAAARAEDIEEYLKLTRVRNARVRLRLIVSTIAATVLIIAGTLLALTLSSFLWWSTVFAVLMLLGQVGMPADQRLIDPARVKFRHRKLSADIVTRAFVAAGLTRADQGLTFPRPITQEGDGWRVVVDLPFGKTFTHALKAHEQLASGLDAAQTQVFLDRDPSSARRVSMWVAKRDPLAVPTGRSPLIHTDRVDFWKPFPWGMDERGNEVMVTMLWLSLLVGAVPRQGKTFSARTIALAAALDPYVRLYVFDGKASPDWRRFDKVAHRIGFGIAPYNGIDPVQVLLGALRELKADVESRYQRLSELPISVCPEGKLTPELSRNKSMGMPLTLVVVDEVQEYLQHPEHGGEILDLMVYLARVAPAVGVSLLTSTQKPDDKACPSVLRDQHQARFSLRVGSWQVSDVVLGAGSYSEGLDASRLLKSHKGVGLLKGMSDDSGIVRNYLADGADAERVLTRARALRESEGTLSGLAAGETMPTGDAADLLADVAAVMPATEAKAWSETLVDRLAELRPDVYGEWAVMEPKAKATQLANALKPYGIETGQVWLKTDDGSNPNRRGLKREDILAAVAVRKRSGS